MPEIGFMFPPAAFLHMAEGEEVLFALFTELDAAIGAEDFSRAVGAADKSLSGIPSVRRVTSPSQFSPSARTTRTQSRARWSPS